VRPGLINVDFADVRSVMSNAGTALMGIGRGEGKNRAEDAAAAAIRYILYIIVLSNHALASVHYAVLMRICVCTSKRVVQRYRCCCLDCTFSWYCTLL
jgi:FtsZ family, C-terminal domain